MLAKGNRSQQVLVSFYNTVNTKQIFLCRLSNIICCCKICNYLVSVSFIIKHSLWHQHTVFGCIVDNFISFNFYIQFYIVISFSDVYSFTVFANLELHISSIVSCIMLLVHGICFISVYFYVTCGRIQVTDACNKHGGFYLGSVGGPAAILAQNCIKRVEVLEYPELGQLD